MNAIFIVVLAVVLFGVIFAFWSQNAKLDKAKADRTRANETAAELNGKIGIYEEYLMKLVNGLDKDALHQLRGDLVNSRKNADAAKDCPQREGGIDACRELLDLVDDAYSRK